MLPAGEHGNLSGNHAGAGFAASLPQRRAQLVRGRHVPAFRSHALGILLEVDADVVALEAIRRGVAASEFIAEGLAHRPQLQTFDALKAMIHANYDGDLEGPP